MDDIEFYKGYCMAVAKGLGYNHSKEQARYSLGIIGIDSLSTLKDKAEDIDYEDLKEVFGE